VKILSFDTTNNSLSVAIIFDDRVIANKNISLLGGVVNKENPLIGLEPSAILTFRDEYPDLATDENVSSAKLLATNSYFIDEFLATEIELGNIKKEQFTQDSKSLLLI
jgi:Fe-S oxidoreductase